MLLLRRLCGALYYWVLCICSSFEHVLSCNCHSFYFFFLYIFQAKAMAGDNAVRSLLEKMTQRASSAYLAILERCFLSNFHLWTLWFLICSGFFFFAAIFLSNYSFITTTIGTLCWKILSYLFAYYCITVGGYMRVLLMTLMVNFLLLKTNHCRRYFI